MTASVWSPQADAIPQANVNGTMKFEYQTLAAGLRIIDLKTFAYAPNTNSVLVFKNSQLLTPRFDYIEVNSTEVLLTKAASTDDVFFVVGLVGVNATVTDDTVLRSQLAADTGATYVRDSGEDVHSVLNSLQLADYTALRNYAGNRKAVYITGYLATAAPSGIAGMFVRDIHDTTSIDNGGTIIVAADNTRWKRVYNGFVLVDWFGAIGDGVANDWVACQKAVDFLQAAQGGTIIFSPGKTYRIAGNTIIIWGNNISVLGYGSKLYKDNTGGSSGYYGDALTVFGKVNGADYYGPYMGAANDYSNRVTYTGANTQAKNVHIEGFQVTFGTHSQDAINGISAQNCLNVTIKNCYVTGAPQTAFALVTNGGLNCSHVTLENCTSDTAGCQGFRFNAYNPNAGEMIAKVINCRTINTLFTNSSPDIGQEGLPSSAFLRSSTSDVPFLVSFDNCSFDSNVHLRNGLQKTSFKNCRISYVRSFCNVEGKQQSYFDTCHFKSYVTLGAYTAQIYQESRSTVEGSRMSLYNCVFETATVNGQATLVSVGGNMTVDDCIGDISHNFVPYDGNYPNRIKIKGCRIAAMPGTNYSFAGIAHFEYEKCTINTSFKFDLYLKTFEAKQNTINVDATFGARWAFYTGAPKTHGAFRGNVINYTAPAYSGVDVIEPTFANVMENQYINSGVSSYDISRNSAVPVAGTWKLGSRIVNYNPAVGSPKAWVCTVAGTPGTWVSEGNL